ncbi:hypothetical protein [Pseudomonas viridiflava]|uniref:hypothetical protein n=1 Tax=Pseudomonas viridiflava TaxID=33069 RepID=UPI000F02EEF8|nr:hypothetical protein [Pseudomonas viridiflava]
MNLKEYLHSVTSEAKDTDVKTERIVSVDMSFESFLIESSKANNTFSTDWVESEVKKSGDYFIKEIYSK